MSQCTYRCVVLPDPAGSEGFPTRPGCLNAPTGAWCSLTSIVSMRTPMRCSRLNAPTGAWCSLTRRP